MHTQSTNRRTFLLFLAFCLSPLIANASALAESPRDELLRLVPEDVGICMAVQDLRQTFQAFRASRFAQKLRESDLGVTVRVSPELKKLRDVELYFQTQFGVGWERILDDVLGDAIVLAYWPGPPGKAEEEKGVVLVRSRDPALLAEVMRRLPTLAQSSENAVRPEARTHANKPYAVWHDGKKETYSYVSGPIGLITHHEPVLQRIIDREASTSRADSPIAQQWNKLGIDKAQVAIWLNPRAFDAEVEHQTAEAPDLDTAAQKSLQDHWKSIDAIALAAAMGENDASLRLTCAVDTQKLPENSRAFFKPSQRSDLWRYFPADAMLTVAGRIDAAEMMQVLRGFLGAERRKEVQDAIDRYAKGSIGRDVEKEVFPALGPDWGFCVLAPPAEEKGWQPYFLAALRIQPGKQEPPLDRALANFLNGMAMLAVVIHNSSQPDAMSLQTEMQGNVEVKFFVEDKKFPLGFRPAFAMKDGFLVVASSPAAIKMFRAAENAERSTASESEVTWMRFSPAAVQKYMADRSAALINQLASQDRIPLEEAEKRIQGLRELIGFFGAVELTHRVNADQMHITMRIRTTHSLRTP